MSGREFDDVVDPEGIEPAEHARLLQVHELLVEAGPAPELPPGLATLAVGATEATPIHQRRTRWRLAGAGALAAALAAAAFGGGYVAGTRDGGERGATAVRVAAMSGSNALASLRVGAPDAGGNWPVDFAVTGLPNQTGTFAYYEVFVLRDGKPGYPCGGFRVENGAAKLRFTVPYTIDRKTKWIVTFVDKTHHWPGRTVMTMA